MSGKRNKKIRQTVKRQLRGDYKDMINAMCKRPLRSRIKIAMRIICGRGI
jgi:hypothetical protein